MFFAALLRCTSYNGNAILFSVVTRVSRRFAQDSTVRAGFDGFRRTRRFAALDGLSCLVVILANTPMESNGQGWVRMLFSNVCLGLSV